MRLRRLPSWVRPGLIAVAAVASIAAATRVGFVAGHDRAVPHLSPGWQPQIGAPALVPPFRSRPGEAQLITAFAAAFGRPEEAVRRVGATNEPTRFRPGLLVKAPFGPVLLSEGQVLGPRSASTGKLAIVYMASSRQGLRPRARFIPAIESGSMGRLGEWGIRSDFGPYPVVEVQGFASWRGVSCAWTTLLELRPEGPFELATIPTGFDDSEARVDGSPMRIEGRIRNVDPGRAFEMDYLGSVDFRDRFIRQGPRYVLAGNGQTRMKSC